MYKVRHRRRADGEAGQEELQREDVVAVEGDELPSVVSACTKAADAGPQLFQLFINASSSQTFFLVACDALRSATKQYSSFSLYILDS